MRDRDYTILSTASSVPVERIPKMPDSVSLQIIPFIEITPRHDEQLKKQIEHLAEKKTTVIFTSAYAVKFGVGAPYTKTGLDNLLYPA